MLNKNAVRQSGKSKAAITEKLVKEKIKTLVDIYAKYNDVYSFCPMTFGYGESGHPDRIILIGGMYIGVEVKKDRNNHHSRPELKAKPNEVMQKRQAEKIKAAGGLWVCIHNDNIQELVSILSQHSKRHMSEFSAEHQAQIVRLVG